MQDYSRLKLKYPLYFAALWVLRDPGEDLLNEDRISIVLSKLSDTYR